MKEWPKKVADHWSSKLGRDLTAEEKSLIVLVAFGDPDGGVGAGKKENLLAAAFRQIHLDGIAFDLVYSRSKKSIDKLVELKKCNRA